MSDCVSYKETDKFCKWFRKEQASNKLQHVFLPNLNSRNQRIDEDFIYVLESILEGKRTGFDISLLEPFFARFNWEITYEKILEKISEHKKSK